MFKSILLLAFLTTTSLKAEETTEDKGFLPIPDYTIGQVEKAKDYRNDFTLQLGGRAVNFLDEKFTAPEFIVAVNHHFYPNTDIINLSFGLDAHYHKFKSITKSYNLGILGQAKGTLPGLEGGGLTPHVTVSSKITNSFKAFAQLGYRVSYYEGRIDGTDNIDAIKEILDGEYYKMVTRGFNTSVGISYIFTSKVELFLAVNSDFAEINYPDVYLDEASGELKIQPSGWQPWQTTAIMLGISSPF